MSLCTVCCDRARLFCWPAFLSAPLVPVFRCGRLPFRGQCPFFLYCLRFTGLVKAAPRGAVATGMNVSPSGVLLHPPCNPLLLLLSFLCFTHLGVLTRVFGLWARWFSSHPCTLRAGFSPPFYLFFFFFPPLSLSVSTGGGSVSALLFD